MAPWSSSLSWFNSRWMAARGHVNMWHARHDPRINRYSFWRRKAEQTQRRKKNKMLRFTKWSCWPKSLGLVNHYKHHTHQYWAVNMYVPTVCVYKYMWSCVGCVCMMLTSKNSGLYTGSGSSTCPRCPGQLLKSWQQVEHTWLNKHSNRKIWINANAFWSMTCYCCVITVMYKTECIKYRFSGDVPLCCLLVPGPDRTDCSVPHSQHHRGTWS